MPTPAENLQTAYENVCQIIADITASPKPTYNIDGQNVQWTEYLKMLLEQQKNLLAALNGANPYEHHHQAYT